jgi:hypothetical protein
MKRNVFTFAITLLLLAVPAVAQDAAKSAPSQKKDCEELKKEIAAKLDAKGAKNYELNIVKNDDVKDQTVVGSCEAGTMKITYKRR